MLRYIDLEQYLQCVYPGSRCGSGWLAGTGRKVWRRCRTHFGDMFAFSSLTTYLGKVVELHDHVIHEVTVHTMCYLIQCSLYVFNPPHLHRTLLRYTIPPQNSHIPLGQSQDYHLAISTLPYHPQYLHPHHSSTRLGPA